MFNSFNHTTSLGFRLLSPLQAEKEYDINYNLYLMNFWLRPLVNEVVTELPDNTAIGNVFLINNVEHINNNYLVIYINKYHLIKPILGMKIILSESKALSFDGKSWSLCEETV